MSRELGQEAPFRSHQIEWFAILVGSWSKWRAALFYMFFGRQFKFLWLGSLPSIPIARHECTDNLYARRVSVSGKPHHEWCVTEL